MLGDELPPLYEKKVNVPSSEEQAVAYTATLNAFSGTGSNLTLDAINALFRVFAFTRMGSPMDQRGLSKPRCIREARRWSSF